MHALLGRLMKRRAASPKPQAQGQHAAQCKPGHGRSQAEGAGRDGGAVGLVDLQLHHADQLAAVHHRHQGVAVDARQGFAVAVPDKHQRTACQNAVGNGKGWCIFRWRRAYGFGHQHQFAGGVEQTEVEKAGHATQAGQLVVRRRGGRVTQEDQIEIWHVAGHVARPGQGTSLGVLRQVPFGQAVDGQQHAGQGQQPQRQPERQLEGFGPAPQHGA